MKLLVILFLIKGDVIKDHCKIDVTSKKEDLVLKTNRSRFLK